MKQLQDVPALAFDVVNQVVFQRVDTAAGALGPFQIDLRQLHRRALRRHHLDRSRYRGLLRLRQQRGGQLDQALHFQRGVGGFAGERRVHHVAQLVEGGQQDVGDLGIGVDLVRAQHVEHGLGLVRQLLDLVQPEESAAALDGMGSAKNLVHQLGVGVRSRLFDGQQIGFDGRQMLARLGDEPLQQFIVQSEAFLTHGSIPS